MYIYKCVCLYMYVQIHVFAYGKEGLICYIYVFVVKFVVKL